MSGSLPPWLARWLGIDLPAAGDGATWQLESAWQWAPWATIILVVAGIAWTIALYARESTSTRGAYRSLLISLRIAALCLLLIMLAQWAIAVRITGPPALALVVDRSASMGIVDQFSEPGVAARFNQQLVANGLSEPTRLNLAKILLTAEDGRILRALTQRYRTHTYLLAAGLEQLPSGDVADSLKALRDLKSDGPDSDATKLGENLLRVLGDFRGAPPAAVLLLTDGVNTAGATLAEAAQAARRSGIPIYAVGIGRDSLPRDIELADVLVDDAVFVNDVVGLQAQIKASGLEGQPAKLTLRREGSADVVAEQNVTLPADGATLSARLLDRPTKPGDMTYVVEIAVRDDEVNKQNNRQQRLVSVRDDKVRVLLVQGYPSYEFRFLKSLLERDRTIELKTYLQDADPDYVEQDKSALRSFPVDREDLLGYDVLIIGDVDPRLLPRSVWQHLRAFVAEKGGGAALIAGTRFLPWMYQDNQDIAAILPIELSDLPMAAKLPEDVTRGFVVRPTSLGLQNPAFQMADSPADTEQVWRNLAPLYWLFPIEKLKPGAQVLAEGPRSAAGEANASYPVICFQYAGAGRVLFHAIDSTWRWRIGAGDAYFARYWVQTIRFLARGKLSRGRGAELTADRREYRRGEIPQLRVRFHDMSRSPTSGEVSVVLESAGEDRRRVALRRNPAAEGLFEGPLPNLAVGNYVVVLADPNISGPPPSARFSVIAPPGEFARPEMDSAALKSAAETTHGKFLTMADADRLLTELPAGRRVPVENLPPIPIWNRWWVLTAFLTCLTTEWLLRKRKGMM